MGLLGAFLVGVILAGTTRGRGALRLVARVILFVGGLFLILAWGGVLIWGLIWLRSS